MGLLDFFRRAPAGINVRCAMCKVHARFPESERGRFVFHTCDADLLVAEPSPEATAAALDLFVPAYEAGPPTEPELVILRDRLLYESGETPIPGLEDLLYRIKYQLAEAWPFPEIASRATAARTLPPRIDWGNELEMVLHRMKKYSITKRQLESGPPAARPILEEKLARLRLEPLVPLEED